MKEKRYQIINIADGLRDIFIESLKINEIPTQVLDKNSDKPLVVHRETKQMTYILKGKGYVYLDSDIHQIRMGDLILFENNVDHSFAADTELHLVHWHWPEDKIDEDRFILSENCEELDT